MATSNFWDLVNAQLAELRTATSADDVLRILSAERNPYGADFDGAAGDAFFAGSGGDATVAEALGAAGWEMVWRQASYNFVMEAPNGDLITYVEGDIYRGDQNVE